MPLLNRPSISQKNWKECLSLKENWRCSLRYLWLPAVNKNLPNYQGLLLRYFYLAFRYNGFETVFYNKTLHFTFHFRPTNYGTTGISAVIVTWFYFFRSPRSCRCQLRWKIAEQFASSYSPRDGAIENRRDNRFRQALNQASRTTFVSGVADS